MKTNGEIYDIVMDRKDEFETKRRARNKRAGAIGAAALAVAVCVVAGVVAQMGGVRTLIAEGGENGAGRRGSDIVSSDNIGNYEESTAVTKANDESIAENQGEGDWTGKEMQTNPKVYNGAGVPESSRFIDGKDIENGKKLADDKGFESTTAQPKDASGGTYGGDTMGGWMIPAMPNATGAKQGVKITGEKITDSEAKAYFAENTWIVSALSSSGVPADNLKFSDKGYCHVSYDGTEGKQLEVRQNFRDYLVYNNGKLVAIVTLTKDNGKLSATPAFGGPHFDDYNAFLQKHKGEKLLFVYAGWMEIVITPDGRCINPQGYDISKDYGFEALGNPYDYFYSEAATYIP